MKDTTNISDEEYQVIKAKYDLYHAEREKLCQGRNYVTAEEQKILPPSPTHDEISSLEVYDFRHDIPERYFAYVHTYKARVTYALTHIVTVPDYVTTWTGEILGEIVEYGYRYRSNMGDERINIKVKMFTGHVYHGTYFTSSGDYCRLKLSKKN